MHPLFTTHLFFRVARGAFPHTATKTFDYLAFRTCQSLHAGSFIMDAQSSVAGDSSFTAGNEAADEHTADAGQPFADRKLVAGRLLGGSLDARVHYATPLSVSHSVPSLPFMYPFPGASDQPSTLSHHAIDTTWQSPPPGMEPRVTATLWEEEGTLCFQVEARGVYVARREGKLIAGK